MDPASGKVTRPPSLASSVTAPPLPLRPGSAPPPPKPPRAAAAGRSITPSTISRASDLPTSDVVLYENERRNEVGVFSSLNLLPTDPPAWCDASSQPTLSADALELTSGWEWVGKWVPDSWAYSNRVSGPWVDAEGDCVFRRRKWTRRKRKKHAGAADAGPRAGGGTLRRQTRLESMSVTEAYQLLLRDGTRIDRERVDICRRLAQTAEIGATEKRNILIKDLLLILQKLDHDQSRMECLEGFAPVLTSGGPVPKELCDQLVKTRLTFFSDRQRAAAWVGYAITPQGLAPLVSA